MVSKPRTGSVGSTGFTLIELIIVIAVLSILSATFVFGFRSSSNELALDRSARRLIQVVDQARVNSLSGVQHEGVAVPGGFGIFVQEGTDSIYVFADCNGDGEYQENGSASTCEGGASELVEEVMLEDGISFATIVPCTSGACTLTVRFMPPYATSTFSPALTGTEAVFILEDRSGTTTEVRMNTLGVSRIVG